MDHHDPTRSACPAAARRLWRRLERTALRFEVPDFEWLSDFESELDADWGLGLGFLQLPVLAALVEAEECVAVPLADEEEGVVGGEDAWGAPELDDPEPDDDPDAPETNAAMAGPGNLYASAAWKLYACVPCTPQRRPWTQKKQLTLSKILGSRSVYAPGKRTSSASVGTPLPSPVTMNWEQEGKNSVMSGVTPSARPRLMISCRMR